MLLVFGDNEGDYPLGKALVDEGKADPAGSETQHPYSL